MSDASLSVVGEYRIKLTCGRSSHQFESKALGTPVVIHPPYDSSVEVVYWRGGRQCSHKFSVPHGPMKITVNADSIEMSKGRDHREIMPLPNEAHASLHEAYWITGCVAGKTPIFPHRREILIDVRVPYGDSYTIDVDVQFLFVEVKNSHGTDQLRFENVRAGTTVFVPSDRKYVRRTRKSGYVIEMPFLS